MWKLLLGFIVFAVLAVFLLMKGGADVDMGGEKHGIETSTEEAAHGPAATAASAPEVVAPQAASGAASGAASEAASK